MSLVVELGWEGNEPFHGWNFTGCAHNATCRYSPDQYKKNVDRDEQNDFDWEYPNIAAGFGQVGNAFHEQHSDVDFAFYNRGLWGALPAEKAATMMGSLYNITGGSAKPKNR